ncbi:MAG: hypothetical protein HRT61_11730 [Ekhidna sp.]|nr:hypothetical protein [Ekhidna sp.]
MSNSSEIVDALVDAIGKRPDDFTLGEFRLTDEKTDLSIWIANGLWFYRVYSPFEAKLNLLQKIRLHYYIEKLKAWKACSILAVK